MKDTNSATAADTMAELFTTFKQYAYGLSVPAEFQQVFFKDRDLVRELTEQHLNADTKFAKYLRVAPLFGRVRAGIHRFGFSSIEEHYALSCVVRALKPKRMLEIGVFRGHTALTLLRACDSDTQLVAIDIDPTAIKIAEKVLEKGGFPDWKNRVSLVVGSSVENSLSGFDFVFIDGDHHYNFAAREFVASYNALNEGGIIAIHDIGSMILRSHQDPGYLVFNVLGDVLKGHAEVTWIDSMCRELTNQLLSPDYPSAWKYCTDLDEAKEIYGMTSSDTMDGAGGLAFIRKTDHAHQLNLEQVLAAAPSRLHSEKITKQRPKSKLHRIAARIASLIP